MRRRPVATLLFAFALALPVRAEESRFVYLVRVPATAQHPPLLQTGFLLQGRKGIITALHGVVDGKTFSALNESGDVLNGLTIAAVDLDHDLALLRSPELEDRPANGLPAEERAEVRAGESLRVLGHPQGINLYDKRVIAGTPVWKHLHELIPPASAAAFDRRKSPSAQIRVLNIQGSLVPGDSGAPVLNGRGNVIGIVNGGLLGGAASISWAIPLRLVTWRDAVSAKTRLAELAGLSSRELFAVSPDPDGSAGASGLEHLPETLAGYAQKIRQFPLAAGGYTRDLEPIVHRIRGSPDFEREHPRDAATAYRLYAGALLLQTSVDRHPIRTVDLAYPWVRRALRFEGAFRDEQELREAEAFFGALLVESPPDVLMADLLRHELRVVMVEASAADVSKWVDQVVSFVGAVKKDPKLADALADAVGGRRSNPPAGELSGKEAAALRVGLAAGRCLLGTMLAGTTDAGAYGKPVRDMAGWLVVLGSSESDARQTAARIDAAMRNPNPITAAEMLMKQVNGVRDGLEQRGEIRLASVLRIGFVVGFAGENSRFIQTRYAPTGDQLDLLTEVQKKYTGTLEGDLGLARLPKKITHTLEALAALLQKTPIDLQAVADQCSRFEQWIAPP